MDGYELQHSEELIAHPHNTSVIHTAAVHQQLQGVFGLQIPIDLLYLLGDWLGAAGEQGDDGPDRKFS